MGSVVDLIPRRAELPADTRELPCLEKYDALPGQSQEPRASSYPEPRYQQAGSALPTRAMRHPPNCANSRTSAAACCIRPENCGPRPPPTRWPPALKLSAPPRNVTHPSKNLCAPIYTGIWPPPRDPQKIPLHASDAGPGNSEKLYACADFS